MLPILLIAAAYLIIFQSKSTVGGTQALMIAAALGHATAVEILVSRGADKTLLDNDGKSASELASDEAIRARLAAN